MGDEMMKKQWPTYLIWILATEAVGALSAFLTRQGMDLYSNEIAKPPLSPPSIVFPIVWVILYALMGFSAARIYLSPPSENRSNALLLYVVQLAMNFVWSIIFFNFEAFGLAFFWLLVLWILILWMTLTFRKIDPLAALLQIPYLIWGLFALYLNAGVWVLNR